MRTQLIERSLKQLGSRNAETRADAADALGGIDDPQAVAALAAALADPDPDVRRAAASSLWDTGEPAAAARPALETALEDESPAVRLRAAGALEAIGVDADELVDARWSVARDGSWFDQALAVRDLVGSVPPEQLLAPLLESLRRTPESRRDAFEDWDDEFSGAAVVGRLAATDDPAVAVGLATALDEDGMPRRAIVDAVGRSEAVPPGWSETLVRLSRDPDPALRRTVAVGLARLAGRADGSGGWPSEVLHLLDDADPEVRAEALRAYAASGGDGHPGAAKIAVIAGGSDAYLQELAVEALGDIGDTSEPYDGGVKRAVAVAAGPALLAVIDGGDDEDLRCEAADSYIRLATDPTIAAAELSRMTGDRFPTRVRIAAVRALGPLGRAAASAVPVLEDLTDDPEPLISSAARSSLGEIERGVAVDPGQDGAGSSAATAGSSGSSAAALAWLREHEATFDRDSFYRALNDADPAAVGAYLGAGMSATDPGTTGMPPLHHAVMFGCEYGRRPTPPDVVAVVDLLLDHGADPNALDQQGNPALMRAVGPCDGVVIGRLVEAGADVSAPNATGSVPYTMALAMGDRDAAEALVEGGFRYSAEEAETARGWYADDPEKLSLVELASVE